MDWIDVAQDRENWQAFINAVVYIRVLYDVGKFVTICGNITSYIRTLLCGVSQLVVILSYIKPIFDIQAFSKRINK